MNQLFYVLGRGTGGAGGIYTCRINENGVPEQVALTPLDGGTFLTFSPGREYLYATSNTQKEGACVASFKLNEKGVPVWKNTVLSGGRSGQYIEISPDGKNLYLSLLYAESFVVFSLNEDGSIGELKQRIKRSGFGPNKERQDASHPHCAALTPDHKFIWVNDLGTDHCAIYPLKSDGSVLDAPFNCSVTPGAGPRHVLFDDSGNYAYLVTEMGSSLITFRYANGTARQLNEYSTLPDPCRVISKCAALRFSPDKRFLFASNRGFDSIACFEVLEPGKLKLKEIVSSFGISPRDMNFLPGGKIFAVANETSQQVCFFDYNDKTGHLVYREGADWDNIPTPLYVLV